MPPKMTFEPAGGGEDSRQPAHWVQLATSAAIVTASAAQPRWTRSRDENRRSSNSSTMPTHRINSGVNASQSSRTVV